VGDVDLAVSDLGRFDRKLFGPAAVKEGLDVLCLSKNFIPGESRKADYRINGVTFNVYQARKEAKGAMVLFLTGSKEFNIMMRGKAKEMGLKLNQYGLWQGERLIAARTERQIFAELGINYVSPRDRE
jgi:DNA polymerase/3'-5' exonuclease PolX